MRYGSVCSGIEAATMAWHPLGWEPAFFSEIDKFPAAVLAHHYGSNMPGEPLTANGVPNLGDMTKFQEWDDHAIDLLVGGTPCQDYSVAGLRLGMAGSRGQLTLVFVEILGRYRPLRFVWENVPGVLSSNEGRDFARFLGEVSGQSLDVPEGGWKNAGIVAGIPNAYGLAWRVLDAQYVRTCAYPWAVPQRRRRVFVVGYLGDWRRAAAVLFDGDSLRGDSPPRRETGQGLTPTLSARTKGGGGLGTDFEVDGGLIAQEVTCSAGGFSASGDGIWREGIGPLRARAQDSHESLIAQEVANPLTARMHKGVNTTMDEGQTMVAVSCPLTAGMAASAARMSHEQGALIPEAAATDWSVRRLMPIECDRLQGFPDDFTRIPYRGKPADKCPDGPRYKALGNSMAVNVMQWLGERIAHVDAMAEGGS